MKVEKQFLRDGKPVTVVAERVAGQRWRVRVGERSFEVDAMPVDAGGVRVVPIGAELAGSFVAYATNCGTDVLLRANGRTFVLAAPSARRGGNAAGSDGQVRAPMTGTVLEVLCKPGEQVAANQPIVVLSAMKMEHKLCPGRAGVVTSVAAQAGTTVEQGALLAVVEPAAKE